MCMCVCVCVCVCVIFVIISSSDTDDGDGDVADVFGRFILFLNKFIHMQCMPVCTY